MFSIIDNEIKVNFEILGGSSKIPAVGKSVSISTTGPVKIQVKTILPNVLSMFRDNFGTDALEKLKELQDSDLTEFNSNSPFDSLTNSDINSVTLPTKAPEIIGGSLDDALSKGIQLELIGGAASSNEILLFNRLLAFIFQSNNTKVKELKNIITKGKSDEAFADYVTGSLSLTGNNVNYENITKRVNNILQIKKGDKFISIEDYWNGMTHEIFAVDNKQNSIAQAMACFINLNPIFDKDGKANPSAKPCLDFIKGKNNWKITVKDIQKIHPAVAFNILNSLGFKGNRSSTSGLVKVQTYDQWFNNLNSESKKELVDTHGKIENAELIKNIIAFVNANPAILNAGDIPQNAEKTIYGVPPALFNVYDGERKKVYDTMTLLKARLYAMTGDKIFAVQSGGYVFPSRSLNKIENFPLFSKQLRQVYNNLQGRLKQYQKTLGEITKQKIESIFSSLEKHEAEAKELITLLETYYIDVKANKNKVAEIMTNEALEKAKKNLSKNIDKITGRATSVIDIEQVINNAVYDSSKFLDLPVTIQ